MRIKGEKARRSLAEFVRQAWHVVEPGTPLEWSWHVDAVCQHLEAVARGDVKRLIINIPPGHMKSLLCSVFFPAWMWTHSPEWRGIFGSYALSLAMRDSVKTRDIIRSDWYRLAFANRWTVKEDQDTKGIFHNSMMGARQCVAVDSAATGFRGDCFVIDDPLNVKDAHNERARVTAIEWINKTTSTRLNDPRTGTRILVMQRLHENDPTGELLRQGGWEHLCIPSEFTPGKSRATSIGWVDPRKKQGELLFPERFGVKELDEARKSLGDDYEGQHNQSPSPPSGLIFKRWQLKYWAPPELAETLPPVRERLPSGELVECEVKPLPALFSERGISWDFTFKGEKSGDYVVGQVWADKGANSYLLDQVRDKIEFTGQVEYMRNLCKKYPTHTLKIVEEKANGAAIISMLRDEIGGIVAENPKDDKVTRARASSHLFSAGNVYLPHPAIAPWVDDFLDELTKFPRARHDDQVDAMTQWLNRQGRGSGELGGLVNIVGDGY